MLVHFPNVHSSGGSSQNQVLRTQSEYALWVVGMQLLESALPPPFVIRDPDLEQEWDLTQTLQEGWEIQLLC